MVKKKQSRFSVSIPYKVQDVNLLVQPITWPEQCPCCNEKVLDSLGTYKYQHKARSISTSTGTQTVTTSFPLEWDVPYCLPCQEHMKIAENSMVGIVAACIFIPLILVLIIDASSTMLFLLMYALFIIGGLILYKIIQETVVKRKLKPTCQGHGLAFSASSPPTDVHDIVFNFDSEDYARTFAELNNAALVILDE